MGGIPFAQIEKIARMPELPQALRDAPAGACAFESLRDDLLDCRAKSRLPGEPRSVLVFLFPYLTGGAGNLSRYAVVPDYHGVVTPALNSLAAALTERFPPYSFVAFTDNSPVPEVRAAALCGLGVMGDNGLLIHPRCGSWVFIGEIVTDCAVEPTGGEAARCLQCGRCRKACPGGALSAAGFDRTRCLSHITQKKGALTDWERDLIKRGGLAWGCDICQTCCPMNEKARQTNIAAFLADARPDVEKDAAARDGRAYTWRGPGVVERNLKILEEKD